MRFQTVGTFWDTSGDHLAPTKGCGGTAQDQFENWFHDAEAQAILLECIAHQAEHDDVLVGSEDKLEAIRAAYLDDLWHAASDCNGDGADWVNDLAHDVVRGDDVSGDPARFLIAGASA